MQELPAAGETAKAEASELDPKKQTAVLLVNAYSGLGIHTLLILLKTFPGQFKQVYFASVGVLDRATSRARRKWRSCGRPAADDRQVRAAGAHAGAGGGRRIHPRHRPGGGIGAAVLHIRQKFPRSVFFAGKLLFEAEKWYYPLLHNETAFAISRRLQLQGIPMVVMPIRILKYGR